jgi:hypothetical protein
MGAAALMPDSGWGVPAVRALAWRDRAMKAGACGAAPAPADLRAAPAPGARARGRRAHPGPAAGSGSAAFGGRLHKGKGAPRKAGSGSAAARGAARAWRAGTPDRAHRPPHSPPGPKKTCEVWRSRSGRRVFAIRIMQGLLPQDHHPSKNGRDGKPCWTVPGVRHPFPSVVPSPRNSAMAHHLFHNSLACCRAEIPPKRISQEGAGERGQGESVSGAEKKGSPAFSPGGLRPPRPPCVPPAPASFSDSSFAFP